MRRSANLGREARPRAGRGWCGGGHGTSVVVVCRCPSLRRLRPPVLPSEVRSAGRRRANNAWRSDDDRADRDHQPNRPRRPATRPRGSGWSGCGAAGPSARRRVAELHALLLKAARFEIGRRRAALPHLRGGDHDDLAQQSADDALVAVLGKLDDFRGESRFTTWAYKFALLEAAVKVRRRAWQGREIPLEEEAWAALADTAALDRAAGRGRRAVRGDLREEIEARAEPAPARGARRRGAQRRADRRPRRAPATPPAAPSTRPCTTPAASCARRSPSAASSSIQTREEER